MLSLITLISGAILPLAFAPFDFWPLSILSLVILLFILKNKTPKKAFFYSWLYGLGVFGAGVSWIYVSIHDFGSTNMPFAILLTLIFVSFIALFFGLFGFLLKFFYKKTNSSYACIGFPVFWVLIEWFRSWFLTGFPWLLLGYSQTDGPLRSFAPIVGVYGISFIIALSSGLIFSILNIKKIKSNTRLFIKEKTSKIINFPMLFLIIIGLSCSLLKDIIWTTKSDNQPSVAILQGNISPVDKFLQKQPIVTIDKIYGEMSRSNLDVDFIIWPENSLPLALPHSKKYIDAMEKIAKENNTSILLGLPQEAKDDFDHYYNSLMLIGKNEGIYHKRQLVPFGDYLPFEKYLRGLISFFNLPMSSFISGKKEQELLTIGKSKILPLICYEIAYPNLIRNTFKQESADVIVTISEDGWFGKSIGPKQHFQMVRMRAMESGRYILRATTSGISAIVAPDGTVVSQLPEYKRTFLKGKYTDMKGKTPWLIIGTTPLLLLLFLMFLLTNDRTILRLQTLNLSTLRS